MDRLRGECDERPRREDGSRNDESNPRVGELSVGGVAESETHPTCTSPATTGSYIVAAVDLKVESEAKNGTGHFRLVPVG